MALFDVYVEGATEASPEAIRRLAEVMSQRYDLPADELANRLSKGRFRVKANVDDATAQSYVRDLEAVGARVTLVAARGSSLPPPRSQSPSQPPPHPVTVPPRQRTESRDGGYSINRTSSPSTPPATESRPATHARPQPGASLPPANASRPQPGASLPPATHARPQPGASLPPANVRPQPGPSLPPRNVGPSISPSNQPYASGLSAAFHEDAPVPQLSAFDGKMSVDSLDGVADPAPEIDTSPSLPASIGPPTKPYTPKLDKPKDVPVDLFAPPQSQSDGFEVELAVDDVAHQEVRKKAATPPLSVPVAVGPSSSSPVLRPKPIRSSGVRLASVGEDTPRWRFAAGVLAAVVLGFIPASCVQSCRESSAFDKIDAHVATVQHQAATSNSAPVPFAQLDAFRDEQLGKKKSEHRNITLVSMLIWALGGAGIGYVWFRRVPWDKIPFGK